MPTAASPAILDERSFYASCPVNRSSSEELASSSSSEGVSKLTLALPDDRRGSSSGSSKPDTLVSRNGSGVMLAYADWL